MSAQYKLQCIRWFIYLTIAGIYEHAFYLPKNFNFLLIKPINFTTLRVQNLIILLPEVLLWS